MQTDYAENAVNARRSYILASLQRRNANAACPDYRTNERKTSDWSAHDRPDNRLWDIRTPLIS